MEVKNLDQHSILAIYNTQMDETNETQFQITPNDLKSLEGEF